MWLHANLIIRFYGMNETFTSNSNCMQENIEYEGALRFFLEHGENNFTKAVRLTSSTTWIDLKPQLHEKFNLVAGVESGKLVPILYAVKEIGEWS